MEWYFTQLNFREGCPISLTKPPFKEPMVTSVDWGRYNNPWFLGTILGKKETSPLDPDNHATVLVTGTGWKRTLFLLGGMNLRRWFIWFLVVKAQVYMARPNISTQNRRIVEKTLGRFSSTQSTIPWFSSLSCTWILSLKTGEFIPDFLFPPSASADGHDALVRAFLDDILWN